MRRLGRSGGFDQLATHGQLDALDGPLLQFVILGNGVGQPNQYGQQKGLNNQSIFAGDLSPLDTKVNHDRKKPLPLPDMSRQCRRHVRVASRINPHCSDKPSDRGIFDIHFMSDVKYGLKLVNKGFVTNDRFGELLVDLSLGVFMDRQIQGQF